jgi:glucose/mannose-6-phosphate isomerase
MSILDQPDRCASIDPDSMNSLLESFPEHVEAAMRAARERVLSLSGEIRNLIVTGLGGSAIGGDLIRSLAGRNMRIPLIINRDYNLPSFVDAFSLVFVCSYSGNTEETISAYSQARRANAGIVCITSGGKLEAISREDGHPVIPLPSGFPPRAALGHALVALLGAIQAIGIVPDMSESIVESVGLLRQLRGRYGFANPESRNPAKAMALSLHGKIVAIYGSNEILDGAAYRWRTQIAENAKNLAFHHVLPEMNHNELVGWLYPQEVLRGIGVVLLRDKGDHPQVQRRFELTRKLISEKAGAVHEVWSEGDSLLARALSVIYLGDYVSLYLAYLNGVDPMPVRIIDYLKNKLGSEDPA